jgi:hypothetical protein
VRDHSEFMAKECPASCGVCTDLETVDKDERETERERWGVAIEIERAIKKNASF